MISQTEGMGGRSRNPPFSRLQHNEPSPQQGFLQGADKPVTLPFVFYKVRTRRWHSARIACVVSVLWADCNAEAG